MAAAALVERIGQSLTPELCRALVAMAQARPCEEVCGYIEWMPEGAIIYPVRNVAPDPASSFVMDLSSTLGGWAAVYYYWHSHPFTRAVPSRDDVAFMNHTRVPMVIVSLKATPTVVLYGFAGRRIVQFHKWRDA